MTVQINEAFVRAKLAQKQMTILELAAAMGVSNQTVHNLLNGSAFKAETLGKMADVLDTTPSL